jgi:maltose alpha-D-glucosyltransferase/alpha-amylase
VLEAYADLWSVRAGQVFLGAYKEKAADAAFLPKKESDYRLLLGSFLILKALYELRYELNNRPKWVAIPLRGISKLLDEVSPKSAAMPA